MLNKHEKYFPFFVRFTYAAGRDLLDALVPTQCLDRFIDVAPLAHVGQFCVPAFAWQRLHHVISAIVAKKRCT
jgi:hypothetical protein